MKRYHMSTRVLGAFAALTLAPAAFAQTAQDPVPNDPANDGTKITEDRRVPSGNSYGQQPRNQARVPEMSDTHRTQESSTTTQSPSTLQPRAIDPREVQQVFGQQASVVDIKSLTIDEGKNLQQRLKDLGYYQGNVDGVAGPKTKSALNALVRSQFVLTQRMVEQGQMPSQLVHSMGLRTELVPTSGSMNDFDTPPQTAPRSNGQPMKLNPLPPPPASYDVPPANYDGPQSPSGNGAPAKPNTAPKR